MSLYLGDKLIAGAGTPTLDTRNVGQIIPSMLPLSDAGLHLLDGALINGSGSYAEFVTYISGLVSSYPNLFITESDWQTSVVNYGVCGKFVYDSSNNTVRLPKITGIIEGTVDTNALGDLVEAGLPNITGRISINSAACGYGEGPLFETTEGHRYNNGQGGKGGTSNIGFDASRSSSVFGNSDTVQPQTIKAYYYIVIANSTKTEIEVDIDQIATDLNGKADTDLANITNDGKQAIINSLMPDYENVISVDGVARGTYTQVVKDSFVITWGSDPYTENYYVYVSPDNGTTEYIVGRRFDDENGQTEEVSFSFFVPKGWSFTNNIENGYHARIYPLKGAQ